MIRTIFLFAFLLFPSLASASEVDVEKIVREVDKLYRSSASYAEMSMTIETPDWKRTLEMKAWTRTMDETFIRILSPKKDAGIATLRRGKEMWNYYPKVDKVLKVPPSMMMGSWMGSDFTNDDLVKESSFLEDYNYRLITPKKPLADYYYIEFIPKTQTVTVWGKIIIAARKKDYIPVEESFFDEKGVLMRVMWLSDIKEMGGKLIPAFIEIIPRSKEGQKTTLRYKTAVFATSINSDVFTLRNLRRRD